MKTLSRINIVLKVILSLFGLFVLVMMIGEGFGSETLKIADILALILMPFVYFFAILVMWKKELLGSILIILDIILLNIVFMIGNMRFSLDIEFGVILLLGLFVMVLSILKKRN